MVNTGLTVNFAYRIIKFNVYLIECFKFVINSSMRGGAFVNGK